MKDGRRLRIYLTMAALKFKNKFLLPGGFPRPRLLWFTNPDDPESHPIDTTFELTPSHDATQNALVVKSLTRDYFRRTFWCLADNNNVTAPAATNVTIEMKRKYLPIFQISYSWPLFLSFVVSIQLTNVPFTNLLMTIFEP